MAVDLTVLGNSLSMVDRFHAISKMLIRIARSRRINRTMQINARSRQCFTLSGFCERWRACTQGGASLALGYLLIPLWGTCQLVQPTASDDDIIRLHESVRPTNQCLQWDDDIIRLHESVRPINQRLLRYGFRWI